jgi:hypothetical protein
MRRGFYVSLRYGIYRYHCFDTVRNCTVLQYTKIQNRGVFYSYTKRTQRVGNITSPFIPIENIGFYAATHRLVNSALCCQIPTCAGAQSAHRRFHLNLCRNPPAAVPTMRCPCLLDAPSEQPSRMLHKI